LEEFDVNFILNLIDIGNIPGQVEMVLQRLHGERPAYELADLTRCVEQVLRIHRLTAQARKEKREALLEWCRKNKKENLQIVQAEIFVDPRARDDLFHIIRRSEMGISVNTNAFWADSIEHVRAMGDALRAAAEENTSFDKKQRSYLVNLDITLSPYHQEVVVRNGALRERVDVRNIARVCSVFGSEYPMIRVWVHRTDGPGVNLLTEEFQVEMERMGYYIVYYKGRGPRVCSIRKKGESALFKNIELDMNKPPPVEGEGYSELLEPFEYEGSSISGTDTVDGTNRRNYFEQPTLTAEGGFSAGEDRYGQYWMVDNLRYRSAGEIMEFSARDPLQRAIIDDRAHLFLLAEEVEPGLSEKLSRVQGSYALTRLLENAPMRLYLTQRLIQEETGKRRFRGPVIRADIGIGADIGALQHEYEMNKRRNGQTYDDVLAGGLAIPEGPVAPSLSVREHRAVTENI
ncbi:MAG: hypothetical protein WCG78_08205, partial [Candidatus Omnitrophota bacterium]